VTVYIDQGEIWHRRVCHRQCRSPHISKFGQNSAVCQRFFFALRGNSVYQPKWNLVWKNMSQFYGGVINFTPIGDRVGVAILAVLQW